MKFGISTWFFQEFTIEYALERIRSTGFDVAEIWMEHFLRTGEKPAAAGKLSEKLGLELTLHATSYDLNLTSINEGIRKESVRQAYEAVVTAAECGAKIVVLHPGKVSSLREDRARTRERLFEILSGIDTAAQENSVTVALEIMENRPREIFVTVAEVLDFLSREWKNIRLTFDAAHVRTVCDPCDFLSSIPRESVAHVHLSDGDEKHIHMPLGRGNIEINRVLSCLSGFYDGNVVIEGYIPGEGDTTAAENYGYLLNNGWVKPERI